MSNTLSVPRRGRWLTLLLKGQPHQEICHDTGHLYLSRWYLIPRNRRRNIYLHRFHSSDNPSALHDHPWPFISLILRGGYHEITEQGTKYRRAGTIARRPADGRHRIVLPIDELGNDIECLTLIITGPNIRQWGFWCPQRNAPARFVPWHQFGPGGCAEPTEEQPL